MTRVNSCVNGYKCTIEDKVFCRVTNCNCTYATENAGSQTKCMNYANEMSEDKSSKPHVREWDEIRRRDSGKSCIT